MASPERALRQGRCPQTERGPRLDCKSADEHQEYRIAHGGSKISGGAAPHSSEEGFFHVDAILQGALSKIQPKQLQNPQQVEPTQQRYLCRCHDDGRGDFLRVTFHVPEASDFCSMNSAAKTTQYLIVIGLMGAEEALSSPPPLTLDDNTFDDRSLLQPTNAMRQFGSYFFSSLTQNCAMRQK
jgi:hypothetical protein